MRREGNTCLACLLNWRRAFSVRAELGALELGPARPELGPDVPGALNAGGANAS